MKYLYGSKALSKTNLKLVPFPISLKTLIVPLFNCTNSLLELIFSHQNFVEVRGEDFQKWTLTKKEDACTVMVSDGNGNIIKTIEISFSDFPIEEFNLWFCDGVLLLPQEY